MGASSLRSRAEAADPPVLADRTPIGVSNRDQYLAGLQVFVEQGLSVRHLGVAATAGDLGVIVRTEVAGDSNVSSFLQIGGFDTDGNLARTIEFDDDALAELAHITGEPIKLLGPLST